jgi:ribonuclease BN (tRNA processing enzyme)
MSCVCGIQLAIVPDTNDSSSMAQLAAGADVLVHDCTGTIDKRHLLDPRGHSDASKCFNTAYFIKHHCKHVLGFYCA